jgi:lipoprotein-anchoring transpeptidase ErfK/SrfK
MPRRPSLVSALLLLSLAMPATAGAQTPPPPPPGPRIAPGITVAGVDVSNLTIPEAAAKLDPALTPAFERPVAVAVAGKRFTLTPGTLKLDFDPAKSARRAFNTGKEAAGQPKDVAAFVTYRRGAIDAFTTRVDKTVYVRPRNATVRITVTHIYRRRSAEGRDLNARALRKAIEAVLLDPAAARLLKPGRAKVRAAVNGADLAKRYRTVVTVNRSTFKLRLFKGYKLSKTYSVAVGAEGFDTPARLYNVTSRQVNPPWTAPNKPWAGLYAGRTVGGGSAENPLKARWLGLADGVGIHGTGDEGSIGSRASHGCIRMRVRDVIDLYPRVPLGTPVLIR